MLNGGLVEHVYHMEMLLDNGMHYQLIKEVSPV